MTIDVQKLKVEFIEKIERTGSVSSFRFRPEKRIDFLPGQFLQIFFDDEHIKNRSLNKYLSFSSAPERQYIEVTKRISDSSFSKRLLLLRKGDKVSIKAPMGSCIFEPSMPKLCFLAGGIGITPVISIIEHVALNSLKNDIRLIYSNRSDEDIAFKKELDAWSSQSSNIKVTFLVSDKKSQNIDLHKGFINKDLLTEFISDFCQRKFFIFGPPAMVEDMKNICYDIGCKNKNVCTENFIGY
ncbi:MAG: FAD-dependent oxidoreductase [Candidatus Omnitrophica bacterium]|nr:FAD-dependent oxidoreductase [Candidatus Omnitrophota bacterium]